MLDRRGLVGPPLRRLRRSGLVAIAAALITSLAAAGPASVAGFDNISSTRRSPLGRCRDGPEDGRKYLNSEVETFAAVDPTNPLRVAVGYQQDRWSNGGARGVLAAISNDGGQTWTRNLRTKTSFCTGGRPRNGGDFERATDPWVTFAPNGDLFLMALSLNQSDTDHAMLVTKFDPVTGRWSRPRTLIREDDTDFLNDKNSLTADPNEPDGSHVYAVWDRVGFDRPRSSGGDLFLTLQGPTYFARTTNGGRTWEKARVIYDPGDTRQTLGNQIVVSPNIGRQHVGQLVNIFALIQSLRTSIRVAVVRSFDQGMTWSDAIVVSDMFARGTKDPDPDDETRRDDIRTGALIPDVAVDASNGNLYAVWQDSRYNDFDYDGIVFSRSTDGGETWSEPIRINKTPDVGPESNRQAFTPSVAVAPDGTIGVSYYDFRNNDTANHSILETDHWLVHCHPSAATHCTAPGDWAESPPVGNSFNMKAAPYARGYFVGDYAGLVGVDGGFFAVFGRARSKRDPSTVYGAFVATPLREGP